MNGCSLKTDAMLQATLERTSSPTSPHPRNDLRMLEPATTAEGRASRTGAFAFPSTTSGRFLGLDHPGDSQSVDARPDEGKDERGRPRSPGQPLVELTCFPGGLVPRIQNIPST